MPSHTISTKHFEHTVFLRGKSLVPDRELRERLSTTYLMLDHLDSELQLLRYAAAREGPLDFGAMLSRWQGGAEAAHKSIDKCLAGLREMRRDLR